MKGGVGGELGKGIGGGQTRLQRRKGQRRLVSEGLKRQEAPLFLLRDCPASLPEAQLGFLGKVLAAELGMGRGGEALSGLHCRPVACLCLHNTFGLTAEIRASPQLYLRLYHRA